MKLELKNNEGKVVGIAEFPLEEKLEELKASLSNSSEFKAEDLKPYFEELAQKLAPKQNTAEELVAAFEKHDIRGFEPLVARIFNTLKNEGMIKQKDLVAELPPEANEPQAETEETLVGGIMLDIIDHADPEHGYFPWVEKGKFAKVVISEEEVE